MTDKYPRNKVVVIDVDGTLYSNGVLNDKLAQWIKDQSEIGTFLILWSARGKAYAEEAAKLSGLTEMFNVIISKPGYIVDNEGWGWIKYTKALKF